MVVEEMSAGDIRVRDIRVSGKKKGTSLILAGWARNDTLPPGRPRKVPNNQ
jgi:hypothetical protein